MRLSHRQGDLTLEAFSWAGKGLVELARSDHEAAASSTEKAVAIYERSGDGYMAAFSRFLLGMALLAQGKNEPAQRALEAALAWARGTNNPSLIHTILYGLAQSALARGDHAEAARTLEEGIELLGQTRDRATLAHFFETLAAVSSWQGETERPALLLGAAERLLREVGTPVRNFYGPDPHLRERAVAEARAGLGEAAFEEAWERVRGMTLKQAVEYALGNRATRSDSVSR